MSSPGPSPTVRKETSHTVSLVLPHLAPETSVLDIGCGEGWVADELCRRWRGEIAVVDVVDVRRTRTLPFSLYDGLHLPFPDARFDVAMLNFVLHHVPDEHKVALLREALRVARRTVFILEDTPVTPFDRFVSRRHGEAYRRKIASDAPVRLPDPQRMDVAFPRHGRPGRQPGRWDVSADRCCSRSRAPRSCSTRASSLDGAVNLSPRAGDESSSRRRSAG